MVGATSNRQMPKLNKQDTARYDSVGRMETDFEVGKSSERETATLQRMTYVKVLLTN